jgi:RimJ/RimL family protein N-acetyltransferase
MVKLPAGRTSGTLRMSNLIEFKSWWALSADEQGRVLALRIDQAQTEFEGTIERAVAAASQHATEDVCGLAILRAGDVAGFLVLKRRSKSPTWASPQVAVLSAMRIDQAHQGKGIGGQALLALPSWLRVHWPDCNTLALSVDEANVRGIRAYEHAGFVDTGAREQGWKGQVRYMSIAIAEPAQSAA